MPLAKAIDWTGLPDHDPIDATPESREAFVRSNAALLASMHEALSKPAGRPTGFTNLFFEQELGAIGYFRDLARAKAAAAEVAKSDGQHAVALEHYLDVLRLSEVVSTGGLKIDDLVADAIAGVGLQGLVSEIDDFAERELETLRRLLASLDHTRKPVDEVIKRDELWSRLAFGWTGRLSRTLERIAGGEDGGDEAFANARRRVDAHRRLILAEAAVRSYIRATGSPPESLADLVPTYLTTVPEDPYRNSPMVYRRISDGYLLYSVGANRIDDNGQKAFLFEAAVSGVGDFFFDANPDFPDESDSNGSASGE
jgi:hypothetical protein